MRVAEFTPFREAPLTNRDRELRVASRRQRVVRKHPEKRRDEACGVAVDEGWRQRQLCGGEQLHAIPQTTVREEVIVLPLIPRAVGQQPLLEQCAEPVIGVEPTCERTLVVEYPEGRQYGHFIPHLPVGCALVVRGDERGTGCDQSVAQSRTDTICSRRARGVEQVEGMAEIEQPDRLEVRAKERASRAEDVVAIGPVLVAIGELAEDAQREVRMT